jgi:anti-anti-sigma factor
MSADHRKPRKMATVELRGPLVIGQPVRRLKSRIHASLAQDVTYIRLDAAKVPYADGSGLGALAECMVEAREAGVVLRIEKAQGKFKEMLELTGLVQPSRRGGARKHPATRRTRGRIHAAVKSYLRLLEPGVA